ncbi:anti-repressor SinI family protein [Halobacillus sp. BBL2006]|nr:anti-repressor SinI family protein [Halobacillus sp. BBL2006]
MRVSPEVRKLDEEWVGLLKQAKAMGIDKEEIREYIRSFSEKKKIL